MDIYPLLKKQSMKAYNSENSDDNKSNPEHRYYPKSPPPITNFYSVSSPLDEGLQGIEKIFDCSSLDENQNEEQLSINSRIHKLNYKDTNTKGFNIFDGPINMSQPIKSTEKIVPKNTILNSVVRMIEQDDSSSNNKDEYSWEKIKKILKRNSYPEPTPVAYIKKIKNRMDASIKLKEKFQIE